MLHISTQELACHLAPSARGLPTLKVGFFILFQVDSTLVLWSICPDFCLGLSRERVDCFSTIITDNTR